MRKLSVISSTIVVKIFTYPIVGVGDTGQIKGLANWNVNAGTTAASNEWHSQCQYVLYKRKDILCEMLEEFVARCG